MSRPGRSPGGTPGVPWEFPQESHQESHAGFRPDFRRGYLRVPLPVWLGVFCRPLLTRRECQLVSVVLRESWGWQAPGGEPRIWTRSLASRDFARLTGLSTDHLRRDLRALVTRGVLREAEGRYQFVPDPRLWKTRAAAPPKVRPHPPESPAPAAVSALPAPGAKIGNIGKENGPASPMCGLSPAVENPPSSCVSPSVAGRCVADCCVTDRFIAVVRAFTGSLTPAQAGALQRWVAQEGVAAVWRALEPAFRQGTPVARERLLACLARKEAATEGDTPGGKEPHA